MTLRPEYSLGHSEYNAFLFAAVGEEKVGLPLTVLTALTRLGFDPWREAARLSDLPRETAARVFAVTIAMLPEGDWKASESEAIAARLVSWLPGRSAAAIPSVAAGPGGSGKMKMTSGFATWLAWGVLAVALLFLGPASRQRQQSRSRPRHGRVDAAIAAAPRFRFCTRATRLKGGSSCTHPLNRMSDKVTEKRIPALHTRWFCPLSQAKKKRRPKPPLPPGADSQASGRR